MGRTRCGREDGSTILSWLPNRSPLLTQQQCGHSSAPPSRPCLTLTAVVVQHFHNGSHLLGCRGGSCLKLVPPSCTLYPATPSTDVATPFGVPTHNLGSAALCSTQLKGSDFYAHAWECCFLFVIAFNSNHQENTKIKSFLLRLISSRGPFH